MKPEFLVLCLVLISVNCSTNPDCYTYKTEKDCAGKKDYNDDPCCFIEIEYKSEVNSTDDNEKPIKTKEIKGCSEFDKYDVEHMGDYAKYLKLKDDYDTKRYYKDNKVKKYSIKCQSNSLKIGFIGLIAALLL